MADSPTPFFTDGHLGNVLHTFTASAADGRDAPSHRPGERANITDGGHAMYVLAATNINVGDCVVIDRNGNASQITNALATAKVGTVGFCPANGGIPQGSYGWVILRSNDTTINVLTGTAAGASLYTTATAGVLSGTAASQVAVLGVSTNVVGSTGGTASASIVDPRLVD